MLSLVLAQILSCQVAMAVDARSNLSTQIVNLKTNDMSNPLGIDVNPRFKWQIQSSVVGESQTAYRVIVSSDEEFADIVWDSGRVESGISTGIEYLGAELLPSARYY